MSAVLLQTGDPPMLIDSATHLRRKKEAMRPYKWTQERYLGCRKRHTHCLELTLWFPPLTSASCRKKAGVGWGGASDGAQFLVTERSRELLRGGGGRWLLQRWDGGILSKFLSSRIFPKSLATSWAQPQWMVSPKPPWP